MNPHATTLLLVWLALYTGHQIADHWLQTRDQAYGKGGDGWPARLAGLRHVAVHAAVKTLVLAATWATVGLHVAAWALAVGLAVDGASHYWADRSSTLLWLAGAMDKVGPFGKADFYRLGAPRPGRDDNPSMGTGAAALDQSWHMVWLFIAALLAAAL